MKARPAMKAVQRKVSGIQEAVQRKLEREADARWLPRVRWRGRFERALEIAGVVLVALCLAALAVLLITSCGCAADLRNIPSL